MAKLKFREAAIEQATSPEQLEELIRITPPRDWLMFIALIIVLAFILLWGFLGSVPTRVKGDGLLLAEKGAIYDAVAAEGAAKVSTIKVKLGDRVQKDQLLIELESPDLAQKIASQESYVKQLQTKYETLIALSKQEIEQRQLQMAQMQAMLEQTIQSETTHLADVEDFLKQEKESFKTGIVSRKELIITSNDFYAIKKTIETANTQLIQNKEALNTFIQDWQNRLRDLDLKITEATHELATLNEQLKINKIILSPISGIVTNIHVATGDRVSGGQATVSIANESDGIDAIIYIDAQEGPKITVGVQALISPTIFKPEEYGSLRGEVVMVSSFPSTPQSMMAQLHNQDLVKQFSEKGAPARVIIRIAKDPTTFSGYQWSSGSGPEQKILPGMIVNGQITIREQKPISLIIPLFKKWLEGL